MQVGGFVHSASVRRTSRGPLVFSHPTMLDVLSVLDRVARSSCTVLVTGESGTGKELIVAALHDASSCKNGPLVAVNCGAIAENLVESELFGHARGAFTGAGAARQGLVAAAEGGTLFLDEIGELSPAVQVKLLRLLQQREYTPVGENRAIKSTARIVAATNRDLAAEVASGTFREDLYYRLNVIHLHVPTLRERREDVPLLADALLRACAERTGRSDVRSFSADALALLCTHSWPGNVRELENVIERAVLLSPGPSIPASCIALTGSASAPRVETPAMLPVVPSAYRDNVLPMGRVEALEDSAYVPLRLVSSHAEAPVEVVTPPAVAPPTGGHGETIDLRAAVEDFENHLIRDALKRTGNNKSRAAQLLGLQRTTFVEMLKRKGIDIIREAA